MFTKNNPRHKVPPGTARRRLLLFRRSAPNRLRSFMTESQRAPVASGSARKSRRLLLSLRWYCRSAGAALRPPAGGRVCCPAYPALSPVVPRCGTRGRTGLTSGRAYGALLLFCRFAPNRLSAYLSGDCKRAPVSTDSARDPASRWDRRERRHRGTGNSNIFTTEARRHGEKPGPGQKLTGDQHDNIWHYLDANGIFWRAVKIKPKFS